MRPVFLAAAFAACCAYTPANAATVFSAGGRGLVHFPGYTYGVAGAWYNFTLKQDLPDQASRNITLADLTSITIGWHAIMRILNTNKPRRYNSWLTDSSGIEVFSARITSERGTIRVQDIHLRTTSALPTFGDAGLPATSVEFDISNFSIKDSQGFGGVGFIYAKVPEPAAWAFMLAGFGLMGGAIRQRRRGSRLSACCRSDHRSPLAM